MQDKSIPPQKNSKENEEDEIKKFEKFKKKVEKQNQVLKKLLEGIEQPGRKNTDTIKK
jgi:hypothetical protein